MQEHRREPVKHTCPDIDKEIKNIKSIFNLCKLKGNETEQDLIDIIDDIRREVWDTEDVLEKLRKANSSLRDWGVGEANRVDELEDKIEELESKYCQ